MSRRGGGRRGGGGGHQEIAGSGAERWLLTYADMITLLLALFILLFAMSTIDVQRFEALRRTLAQSFRGSVLQESGAVIDGSKSPLNPDAPSQNAAPQTMTALQTEATDRVAAGFAAEAKRLRKMTEKANMQGKISVTTSERGIVILFAGDSLFESGSAQVREEFLKPLKAIAIDLAKENRQVAVEGHTDGQPISSTLYPDNLALSQARARAVYLVLDAFGMRPDHLRATGFGPTRPIVKPRHPEQAVAKNRRVEVVVLSPGADRGASEVPKDKGAAPAPAFEPIPSVIGPIVSLSTESG
jgi:chemotaxis protein MotB